MFGHIFSGKNLNRRKHLLQSELSGFILAQEHFVTRLRQERLRSERSGSPLSLVIIDITGMLHSLRRQNVLALRGFLKRFAKVLKNSTRESDVKGWYEDGKIALLTPDTNESGARALAENLARNVAKLPGVGFQEGNTGKFISVSSIQGSRNYLAEDQRHSKAGEQLSVTVMKRSYPLEGLTPAPGASCLIGSGTGAGVAAVEWPFRFEIVNRTQVQSLKLKVKRLIDIVVSLIGILFTAPLMVFIAAMIKLTSPGPVLFRQRRLGLLGKPFTFLKFRSMKVDCDPSLHKEQVEKLIRGEHEAANHGSAKRPIFKITNDPRLAPGGSFLRRSSLDELPQLFNVLRGDMSLVGPRPPIPYECNLYEPWHCRRVLEVSPGITGLWQVSGRSATTFEEMVRLDLTYVRTWSLWLDLKILLKTPWAVISAKGSY